VELKFRFTKVFRDTWAAVNAKTATGERRYKTVEQVGGTRSSKTWSDLQVCFLWGYLNPFEEIVVMRDTAVDCRDKVESEWIKWIRDPNGRTEQFRKGEITSQQLNDFLKVENLMQYFDNNKSLHTWTFKHNKSVITFTGTDDPDRAIGKTQTVLWINEPYKFPEEVYKQLTMRTSQFILVDWNPKEDHFIEKERLKDDTITLRSTLLDNPFCPDQTKKQVLSYQPIRCCKVVDLKLIVEEEAYLYDVDKNPLNFEPKQLNELIRCIRNKNQKTESYYHWKVYGLGEKAERPNRIFNWKEIELDQYHALDLTTYYGVDWGKVDPWGIVELKYNDGCVYVKQLNYDSENIIRQRLSSTELNQVESANEEDSKEGVVKWLFRRLNIDYNAVLVCDNNRPQKIIALREAGWEYAIAASGGQKGIKDGIDLLSNLEVYYTSDSKDLASEQENYSQKTDRNGVTLDEPEDTNNHLIDPMRYVVRYLQDEGIINIV
jgi:phage terminase large subunit